MFKKNKPGKAYEQHSYQVLIIVKTEYGRKACWHLGDARDDLQARNNAVQEMKAMFFGVEEKEIEKVVIDKAINGQLGVCGVVAGMLYNPETGYFDNKLGEEQPKEQPDAG